tara:strand:+ start:922 stop:1086 length:165 start_codon:yes stop_codon:yes gene_type:complete
MILSKIVEQLKTCISDCEKALQEDLTDNSEQIYEGRQELAESLLELIESEEKVT